MSERRRTKSPNVTLLSRFFDDNVRLVAGVCSRCYNEMEEVKIVAVNRKFLRQFEARKEESKCIAESSHNNGHCPNADETSYQHCQGVHLKLPTTVFTSTYDDDDCPLITADDGSRGRQIKPRLNYNDYDWERTTENFPCDPELRDLISVSDFLEIADVKAEKEKSSDFQNANPNTEFVNVTEGNRFKSGDVNVEEPKLNLAKLKTWKGESSDFQNPNIIKFADVSEGNRFKSEDVNVEEPKLNLAKLKTWKSHSQDTIKNFYSASIPYGTEISTAIKTEFANDQFKPKHSVNLKKLRRRFPLWSPPRSPHNLIEESLFRDPWSLLVATIFLNRTSCMCARPRVEEFLRDLSDPWKVLEKRPSELEKYFVDLGLHKKRAEQVWRMSHDYVHKNWRSAKELYGIGKYGEDAYKMFILGDLDVEPTDRFLRIYRDWVKMKEREEKMVSTEEH